MSQQSLAPGFFRTVRVLCLLLAVSLSLPARAHAYIDPQSGSIMFQVFVAAILGAVFTLRRWWASVFRRARALVARVVGR
jgi:hypothetical protein